MNATEGKLRPDAPGFWWRLTSNGQWHVGTVSMIWWGEEDDGERVLGYTEGGCYCRCDKINTNGRDDTRYFPAIPPTQP